MSEILVEAVGNLGALGIVLWLVVRFSNHTIPRLATKFEEALRVARTDFKEALASQRKDFAKLAAEQRDFFQTYTETQRDFYDTRIEAEHERLERFTKFIERMEGHSYEPPNNN